MSAANDKIKFLVNNGATPGEAYALVVVELEREVIRLNSELEESESLVGLLREITL